MGLAFQGHLTSLPAVEGVAAVSELLCIGVTEMFFPAVDGPLALPGMTCLAAGVSSPDFDLALLAFGGASFKPVFFTWKSIQWWTDWSDPRHTENLSMLLIVPSRLPSVIPLSVSQESVANRNDFKLGCISQAYSFLPCSSFCSYCLVRHLSQQGALRRLNQMIGLLLPQNYSLHYRPWILSQKRTKSQKICEQGSASVSCWGGHLHTTSAQGSASRPISLLMCQRHSMPRRSWGKTEGNYRWRMEHKRTQACIPCSIVCSKVFDTNAYGAS